MPVPPEIMVRVRPPALLAAACAIGLAAACLAGPDVDCNNNGIPDDQDIKNGTSDDCNGNMIPDECDAENNDKVDRLASFTLQPPEAVTALLPLVVAVEVRDEAGEPAGIPPEELTLSLVGGDPGAAINGVTVVETDCFGSAVFIGISIDKAGTGYRFQVDGMRLVEPGLSAAFDVLPNPNIDSLVFVTSPDGGESGVPFPIQPQVAILDAGGNVIAQDDATEVSLELEIAPPDAVLIGDATSIAVDGIATFTDVGVNKPGFYALRATSVEKPIFAISVPFDIVEGVCFGDFDGDGDVGFDDLVLLLSVYGTQCECEYDLNGDGFIAFPDVLALLTAWGPCG